MKCAWLEYTYSYLLLDFDLSDLRILAKSSLFDSSLDLSYWNSAVVISSTFFFYPSVEVLFPFSLELYLFCIFKISLGKVGAYPSDFSSVSSV